MTAPGGFFSKSSRRAAKEAAEQSLKDDMALVDTPSTPEYPKQVSGGTVVRYDPPGTEARKAVEGAEKETERKHGKMKR